MKGPLACVTAPEAEPLLAFLGNDWDGLWAAAPAVTAWYRYLTPTKFPAYWPCDLTAQRIGMRPCPVTSPSGRYPADTGGDPCVIRWRGRSWIYDGHTRIAARLRAGYDHGRVRVRLLDNRKPLVIRYED